MTKTNFKKFETRSLKTLALMAVIISSCLYLTGLFHSSIIDEQRGNETQYLQEYIDSHQHESREEKILAESYWRRYRDIRENNYWGVKGPLGIWGARDHFNQHGRQEGRIFQPIPEIPDGAAEKKLAQSYWRRYPEIEQSSIWGRKSDLGITGPRDHYQHVGRFQGKIWELPKY